MWQPDQVQTTLKQLDHDARDLVGLGTAEPDRSVPSPEELKQLAGYG